MNKNVKYERIFEDLSEGIKLLTPKFSEYSHGYFINHKERYINDVRIVDRHHKSGSILEVGGHPFHFTYFLSKLDYSVVSLDIDPSRAKPLIDKNDLNVIKCNVETEKLPFDDETFQMVLFNEIFEHLRINPIDTLEEVNRILKPGGIMMLTTPNLYALHTIVNYLIGRGIRKPYNQFKSLKTLGHMGHIREYSVNEVKIFLENTGFEVVDIKYRAYKYHIKGIWGKIANFIYFFTPPCFYPYFIIISKRKS
jgi:SAM-dependent methyltransferase